MINLHTKFADELPPSLILALLYWTLHARKTQPDKLLPFKVKSVRSQGEIQKTIAAYWHFTEKVTRHHHKKILQSLQKNRLDIIHAAAKECGISFPLSEEKIRKTDALTAFFVVFTALFIEFMPDVLQKYDKMAMLIS